MQVGTLSQVYCPLLSALACDGSENKLRETPRGEERGGGQAGHTGHPGQGGDGAQAERGPQVGQGAASWSPASTQHSSWHPPVTSWPAVSTWQRVTL